MLVKAYKLKKLN